MLTMVNTFLIDSDFHKSASLLDRRRLVKQRCEAQQILNILLYARGLAKYYDIRVPSITASRYVKKRFFALMNQLSLKQPVKNSNNLVELPRNKIDSFILRSGDIVHIKNIKSYKLRAGRNDCENGIQSPSCYYNVVRL